MPPSVGVPVCKLRRGAFDDQRTAGEHRGADPPAVVYTCAPGRGREHARALLGGYRGILQCDGYAGYKGLADAATGPGPAVMAYCWSHARRQFYDLAQKAKAPVAEEALQGRIDELMPWCWAKTGQA